MLAPLLFPFIIIGAIVAPIMLSDYQTPHAVIFERSAPAHILKECVIPPASLTFKITWLPEEETLTTVPCSIKGSFHIFPIYPEIQYEREKGFLYERIRFKKRENRKVGYYSVFLDWGEKLNRVEEHLVLSKKAFENLSKEDSKDIENFLERVNHLCNLADPFTKQSILLLIEEEKIKIERKRIAAAQALKKIKEEQRYQEQLDLMKEQNKIAQEMAARPSVVIYQQAPPVIIHHVQEEESTKPRKPWAASTFDTPTYKQTTQEKEKAYERSAMIEGW